MKICLLYALLCLGLPLAGHSARADGIAVIGHADLPRLDAADVQKLFTGRMVEIGGRSVTAVNAPPGSPVRNRFLAAYLNQDEEKYTAYWTVRRFIGKGLPPRELQPAAAVIEFVVRTPGAVGYIDAAEAPPGLNVLHQK